MPSPRCFVVTVVSRNLKYKASTSRSYVILIGVLLEIVHIDRHNDDLFTFVDDDRPVLLGGIHDTVPLLVERKGSADTRGDRGRPVPTGSCGSPHRLPTRTRRDTATGCERGL